jgi:hypothetical protein
LTNGSPTSEVLAADIGDRLPATEGEAKAAEYCCETLGGMGLETRVEEFPSAGSVFRPHLVAALTMLVAFALYPLAPPATRYVALGITVLTVAFEIMELTLCPNPLQWVLPKRPSGNVYAVIEPRDEGESSGAAPADAAPDGSAAPVRDIVLSGHVDT